MFITNNMEKRRTVHLNEENHRKLRLMAAHEDLSLTKMINKIVAEYYGANLKKYQEE